MHWTEVRFYAAITTEHQNPAEQQHHVSAAIVFTIDYSKTKNHDESDKLGKEKKKKTTTVCNLQNRQNSWKELQVSHLFKFFI